MFSYLFILYIYSSSIHSSIVIQLLILLKVIEIKTLLCRFLILMGFATIKMGNGAYKRDEMNGGII